MPGLIGCGNAYGQPSTQLLTGSPGPGILVQDTGAPCGFVPHQNAHCQGVRRRKYAFRGLRICPQRVSEINEPNTLSIIDPHDVNHQHSGVVSPIDKCQSCQRLP